MDKAMPAFDTNQARIVGDRFSGWPWLHCMVLASVMLANCQRNETDGKNNDAQNSGGAKATGGEQGSGGLLGAGGVPGSGCHLDEFITYQASEEKTET